MGEAGEGLWAPPLLVSWHRDGSRQDHDQNGDRKGLGLEKKRDCAADSFVKHSLLPPKLLPESVRQRKLTADSSSCGGGRS